MLGNFRRRPAITAHRVVGDRTPNTWPAPSPIRAGANGSLFVARGAVARAATRPVSVRKFAESIAAKLARAARVGGATQ